LFQPFVQLDSTDTRRHGGTGLGLAICRQLVGLMHGDLGYESQPGFGSSFWFELELPNGAGGAEVEPLMALPPGLRVLVVDDNITNREVVLGQLAHFGIKAEAVADGAAALEHLRARAATPAPCQLALLDWHMPGMNGLQLAATIRADPAVSRTPLVMLSSAGPLEDPVVAGAVGFAAFLVKPVREAQLHRCLARVMNTPEVIAAAARAPTPIAAAPATDGLKLLLVEDNTANQMVAKMLFEKMGHSVVIAVNGQEALAKLNGHHFDAVIMDCQMPVMDGYEATRRIRSGKEPGVNASVPIIALTAHAMPDDRQKCLNAGMDDYMSKPIRPAAIREAFMRCGLLKTPSANSASA
jgi:CheY-like chemotaxis protein